MENCRQFLELTAKLSEFAVSHNDKYSFKYS